VYDIIETSGVPIKAWTRGVAVEASARTQLENVARLPIVHGHVAVMPDVHWGMGATVGSVIPTRGAIIPAAVGVDIGCGMAWQRTSLTASDLPDNLSGLRMALEAAIPHGRTDNGGANDRGAWGEVGAGAAEVFAAHASGLAALADKHPELAKASRRAAHHLGTLGTGNHFVEVVIDEEDRVGIMLHPGSRGIGNKIGTYFIEKAKAEMRQHLANLPDADLAYVTEGSVLFDDYVAAVSWAQGFARANREVMMAAALAALAREVPKPFALTETAVNCHHNYVAEEHHFGTNVWVTRKGAVRAGKGELGIIPGSMGARSFIVRGLGNPESLCSCSHGAGRAMSRGEAKRRFTLADHLAATEGVECRKDAGVIDETPMAYKDIDAVIAAQADLIEVVHTLRQVVCVKG
jgi:tRNA-splicing ligase RtcB